MPSDLVLHLLDMIGGGFGYDYMIHAWLGDLLDRRRKQIDKWGDQTGKLVAGAGDKCPRLVIDFLVWAGEQNKLRTDEIAVAGPWELRDVLKKHLAVIDGDVAGLAKVTSGGLNQCEGLRAFMQARGLS